MYTQHTVNNARALQKHTLTTQQIPLPLLADLAVGAATFDLSLPNPESAVSSLAHKLRFINSALAKAAYGKSEEECAAARHAAAVAEAVKSGSDVPLTMVSWCRAVCRSMSELGLTGGRAVSGFRAEQHQAQSKSVEKKMG